MRTSIALVVALAACGGGGSTTGDARDGGTGGDGGGSDAMPDAMVDADPDVRGTVTVRLVDKNGAALPGMHVVFIDTDTTVTDVTTDTAGVAEASVFPGASVTAVRARDAGVAYSLTTLRYLNPGDDITLISAAGDAISSGDPFTSRTVPLPSTDITGIVKSGSSSMVTTRAPHGLVVGDIALIRDVLQVGYNGDWQVQTVPSPTTFSFGYANNTAGNGGTAAQGIPVTVSFPAYTGATFYEVHSPCGPVDVGTTTSAQIHLRAGCSMSPMDLVVFAKSNATTELAFAAVSAVTWQPGDTITITAPWQPLATVTASYTNPTSRVTELTASRHLPYLRGAASATGTASVTAATTNFALDSALVPSAWMRTTLRCPDGASPDCITSDIGTAQQTIAEQVDGTQQSYALDIGATLLPWVNAVYLPQTQTIDITVTGSGSFDLFEASLRYYRTVNTSQVIYTWRVFSPIAEDVTFPALPNTVPGDPTVRPTDTQSEYGVIVCETDAVGGYREAIANPYQTLATCESTGSTSNVPSAGTRNRVSRWN